MPSSIGGRHRRTRRPSRRAAGPRSVSGKDRADVAPAHRDDDVEILGSLVLEAVRGLAGAVDTDLTRGLDRSRVDMDSGLGASRADLDLITSEVAQTASSHQGPAGHADAETAAIRHRPATHARRHDRSDGQTERTRSWTWISSDNAGWRPRRMSGPPSRRRPRAPRRNRRRGRCHPRAKTWRMITVKTMAGGEPTRSAGLVGRLRALSKRRS
jgi:hypothetical protein